MNDSEREYFESFKKNDISEDEMEQGRKKAKNLGDKANDFLMLIEMLKASMGGEFKIPAWAVATIIGAIVYVVSPIDAVPDIIPFAGWLDDGAVVAGIIGTLGAIIDEYKKFKNK